MAPKGICRVCGNVATPGNMPCYKCCGLLLDRDNVNLRKEIRDKAGRELERIVMNNAPK